MCTLLCREFSNDTVDELKNNDRNNIQGGESSEVFYISRIYVYFCNRKPWSYLSIEQNFFSPKSLPLAVSVDYTRSLYFIFSAYTFMCL